MPVLKKIRFAIVTPALIRKILEEIKNPEVEYRITTDEFGVSVNLISPAKENIKQFLSSLPKDLLFFSIPLTEKPVSELVLALLKEKGLKLSVVESCTGGLLGKIITDIPGSSACFWGGYIVYDNRAKQLLGVPAGVLDVYGAVSSEAVLGMAEKGLEASGADICVSVSGIAGPEGGSFEKPVGTVWIGVKRDNAKSFSFRFSGSRKEIREKAAVAALLVVYRELFESAGVDSNIFGYYI